MIRETSRLPELERRDGHRPAGQYPQYFDYPPVKKAPWKWYIPAYFFVGGIGGGAMTVATIADLFGERLHRSVTRIGRYLALTAALVSPLLLIADLRTPRRFHYMLRIFKGRSPLNVGTWGLTAFGVTAGLTATLQFIEDIGQRIRVISPPMLERTARGLDALGSLFGFFMAGYTGILLAATAVPLWGKNRLLLGPLFLSSALSTALASISLVQRALRIRHPVTEIALKRAEVGALATELGLLAAVEATSGYIGKPLREGRWAGPYRYGTWGLGLAGPLALLTPAAIAGRRLPPALDALVSVMVLAGGLIMRLAIVRAGDESANDPQATFVYTNPAEQRRRSF